MTSTTHLDIVDRSVEKAHIWINEVAAELGTDDRHDAYRALRAFLHALRDRLTVEHAAKLSAQLPLFVRGMFYENWQPGRVPSHDRHPAEFLERVRVEAGLAGETEASWAVHAGATVLRRHVTAGVVDEIARTLPEALRPLLDS